MALKYYVEGEGRGRRVEELFGKIAKRYDRINDIQSMGLHRRWKRQLVDLAPVRSGSLALDVCCGTGDITLALARKGFEVIGVDFSAPMLEVAHSRNQVGSFRPAAHFLQADAMALPFPDGHFDVVTIAYGLRNLTDWQAGLQELVRVTKPGGRLLILEFGQPADALWRRIWYGYLRSALPLFGWWFANDFHAYAYVLESLQHYPGQIRVHQKLTQLGGPDCTLINLWGGMMSIHAVHIGSPIPDATAR